MCICTTRKKRLTQIILPDQYNAHTKVARRACHELGHLLTMRRKVWNSIFPMGDTILFVHQLKTADALPKFDKYLIKYNNMKKCIISFLVVLNFNSAALAESENIITLNPLSDFSEFIKGGKILLKLRILLTEVGY